jgi:hypothetical protein
MDVVPVHEDDGLIRVDGDRVFATDAGYLVLNELVLRLGERTTC